MKKGKAFLIVGHSNWGKSSTLRMLTDGNWHLKYYLIKSALFFIVRMSNDDEIVDANRGKLLKISNELHPETTPHVILAFCPNFNVGNGDHSADAHQYAIDVLDELYKRYDLFFFVLRHQYGTGKRIDAKKIEGLKRYGVVKVLDERIEKSGRGKHLRKFIEDRI